MGEADAGAEPALEARGMSRRFGKTAALDRLTFAVAPGELFGLVGADGAGKTTAIRALAGLIDLDDGEARVLGSDPAKGGAASGSSTSPGSSASRIAARTRCRAGCTRSSRSRARSCTSRASCSSTSRRTASTP